MQTISIKEEARRLVDKLPEESTWDDLMYEIYVRQGKVVCHIGFPEKSTSFKPGNPSWG